MDYEDRTVPPTASGNDHLNPPATAPQPQDPHPTPPTAAGPTVREATYEVLRGHGMTTVFGNPGSTEVPFLTGLPPDFTYVLGLHEGVVVGMATGFAQARRGPVVVNLHAAAGLGNAMGALTTAWHNRAPLVLIVGQQARSHLALGPFLAGEQLDRMPEPYVKWSTTPVRAEDVPGVAERAIAVATTGPVGPVVVVVPMDDWDVPIAAAPVPRRVVHCAEAPGEVIAQVAAVIDAADRPLIVAGAGVDTGGAWSGVVALAEQLAAPVVLEPMGARVGFPQDHPLYAGLLPRSRTGICERLAQHDLVVVVGAPVFRYYLPDGDGPVVPDGCAVLQLTADADEAARSPVGTAVVASLATLLPRLAATVRRREPVNGVQPGWLTDTPALPANGPVTAEALVQVLRVLVPPDTVVVEECPSVRPVLDAGLPTTVPGGWSSSGNGWLGYGLSGAIGLALGDPDRPVLAVVGDGSTLFGLQALWSAARYRVPVVFCVLVNGAYGVLRELAHAHDPGAGIPGTDLGGIGVACLAAGLGVPATLVRDTDSLATALRSALGPEGRHTGPTLIEVALRESLIADRGEPAGQAADSADDLPR